jgi:beta-lactamase class D
VTAAQASQAAQDRATSTTSSGDRNESRVPARSCLMRRPGHPLLFVLTLASLTGCVTSQALSPIRNTVSEQRPELGRFFKTFGAEGTFVLLEVQTGKRLCFNPARAETRFIPASSFKIFNSLVALETRAIADEDEVIRWDGVDRGRPEWNQDQRMREAFQRSTVWFYQELARRIGEERMRFFLNREGYGNRDISGGIDRFWLTGGLRISADEQIEFLRRFHNRELGFSEAVMNTVKELLVMERTGEYTLRGKTGWAEQNGRQIGWLVGSVERQGRLSIYTMNLESSRSDFPMVEARHAITLGILRDLGVLPAKQE